MRGEKELNYGGNVKKKNAGIIIEGYSKKKFAHKISSKLHEAYICTPKLISRNHLLLLEVLILYILKKKKK